MTAEAITAALVSPRLRTSILTGGRFVLSFDGAAFALKSSANWPFSHFPAIEPVMSWYPGNGARLAGTLNCGARMTAVSGKSPSRPNCALNSTWLLHQNQVLCATSMFACAEKFTEPCKCSDSDSILACHEGRFVKVNVAVARWFFSGHSICP